ncbi:unnamed protein product [Moneuplotes crassus]|uniref:Uncharacterized protein n=1 Tax=Euplotes crassus TaxID=5936 RepID=A0AAD2DD13_EUPCR|nr:unnamed protein product [Moneuplotes crassus]
MPHLSLNSQSKSVVSPKEKDQGSIKRIRDWRAEMKFPIPEFIKQDDEDLKMTNWTKISHFILFEKNFEKALDNLRMKRGLKPLKRDSKNLKKVLKPNKKFDTFMDIKKNTAELLKDKKLPENFIENILNILKTSIFNLVVKGLKSMGQKVVLRNRSRKRTK